MGIDSLDMALQSRCRRTWDEPMRWASSTAWAAVVMKLVSWGPSGFQGDGHVGVLDDGQSGGKDFGRMVHGLLGSDARQEASLGGRAEDEDLASHVGAQPGQLTHVFGRLPTHGGVGRG